jgi:hypothetical protein
MAGQTELSFGRAKFLEEISKQLDRVDEKDPDSELLGFVSIVALQRSPDDDPRPHYETRVLGGGLSMWEMLGVIEIAKKQLQDISGEGETIDPD